MTDEDDSYSQPPIRPEGCRAVVPLSDGTRLLLADGSVVRIHLEEAETGAELPATSMAGGETYYGWIGDDDASSVVVNLPRDDEAAQHERVRESLEALGFWHNALARGSASATATMTPESDLDRFVIDTVQSAMDDARSSFDGEPPTPVEMSLSVEVEMNEPDGGFDERAGDEAEYEERDVDSDRVEAVAEHVRSHEAVGSMVVNYDRGTVQGNVRSGELGDDDDPKPVEGGDQ